MASEPHLRALSDDEPGAATPEPAERSSGPGRWIPLLLGGALLIALALLAWSRVQLGERIAVLQDEVAVLEAGVAERDRVIEAHKNRLGEVRLRVLELQSILDKPLPEADR